MLTWKWASLFWYLGIWFGVFGTHGKVMICIIKHLCKRRLLLLKHYCLNLGMEGIYSQCASSWTRKMDLRTASLPGRVFDIPGLLAKRSALSYSGNSVPDVSLFWGLYVHGLLEPSSCSMCWCCSPSRPCVPAPPFSSLPAQRGWSPVPGQGVGAGQAPYWLTLLHSNSPAPRVCSQGPLMSCWCGPRGLLWLHVFTQLILFFPKSHTFQHPLLNMDVSLCVSTYRGVSGQNLKPFFFFFFNEVMVLE